ncbi:hypothetical protein SARC_09314 [Sphaeroforma arctica JP610]|uniref:Uncharacterized protein n=1 Tax=Sphaeroforma arctica JP610 TaxID=667725 RepID=A0A0L0FN92_9EUKA|nr:hypothetical protein SARC_09314 [Sphaeroforma arctica JP610]KNC78247.1 hypothetical protein SARC_09314 [Sphaeroforma arctica JP610]|eukprot:XP_014152149.1 hypothetical protein SARC_09314 [Sphaeroforma arctica JP610]
MGEKEFDSQIQELESEIERITDQLDAQNDYENVKKELDILRNYEFKEEMDHEKTQTVEELLLLKNKRLQKKAAETNALLSDKTNELTQQSETIERLQDEVSLKATLVAELETGQWPHRC